METKDRIIVALDVNNPEEALDLITGLSPYVGCFKIGLELITAVGPKIVGLIHEFGGHVFYDGKFNDIPNTVGRAAKAVSELKVKMFNVHASSGIEALKAAVANKGSSDVFAVTVLTSLKEKNAQEIFGEPSRIKVFQFANDAKQAGCTGIICSPQELVFLSQYEELECLEKITPGIRPEWASSQDQERVATPSEAILAGADMIVIGRPITRPPEEIGNPINAVQKIIAEIDSKLNFISC